MLYFFFTVQEYSLPKGQRIFHFSNASNFTRCPEVVLLCFVAESRHTGSNQPRMIFKSEGLEDLSVYRNGVPSIHNEFMKGMALDDINSTHLDFFYRNLVSYFRPHAAESISRERFCTEFFMVTLEIAAISRTMFPEDPRDTVNLVQAVNLDLDLNFKDPLAEGLQMFLISFDRVVLNIGPSGDIVES